MEEARIDEQLRNQLIDLVFAEEVLWNMKCDTYRNTKNKAKEQKWEVIAMALNISGK